jgi:dCMP deaminase
MQEDKIPEWNEYFFDLAKTASKRSNCLRASVGAVIINPQTKFIRSTGFNGTPSKIESCKERGSCYRMDNNIESGTRYETCRSIHAEQNAIIQAGQERTNRCHMYIYGHSMVCVLCKRFILQAGITAVFLKKDDNSDVQIINPREDWNDL